MEGLLEALPRLARDAAIGVVVPAWWGASSSRAHRASRRGLNCRTDNDDRGDGRRKAQKGDTADVRHAAGRGHGLLSRFD